MKVLKVLHALPEPTSWYMLKSESLTEKINVSNVFSNCSLSYSMNTSTVDPDSYTDIYDYDYNSTCDQDPNPMLSNTVLQIFYYVVFSFGLIGKFNQMQYFKLRINNSRSKRTTNND